MIFNTLSVAVSLLREAVVSVNGNGGMMMTRMNKVTVQLSTNRLGLDAE